MNFDSPPTSEEIVRDAQTRVARDSEESSRWWKMSQDAERSGKPCPICGWQDGDGLQSCFYSKDLGAVPHENSDASAAKSMTPAQRSLFLEAGKMHDDLEHSGDHSPCQPAVGPEGHSIGSGLYRFPHGCGGQFVQHHSKGWSCNRCGQVVVPNDPKVRGMTWSHKHVAVDHRRCVKHRGYWVIPHPNCGGLVMSLGPYHIKCDKCGVEVRMWEHGIDYDVG